VRLLHPFSVVATHTCAFADTDAEANFCANHTPNPHAISAAIIDPDEHSHHPTDHDTNTPSIANSDSATNPGAEPCPDATTYAHSDSIANPGAERGPNATTYAHSEPSADSTPNAVAELRDGGVCDAADARDARVRSGMCGAAHNVAAVCYNNLRFAFAIHRCLDYLNGVCFPSMAQCRFAGGTTFDVEVRLNFQSTFAVA
jgi:hypothetical protein